MHRHRIVALLAALMLLAAACGGGSETTEMADTAAAALAPADPVAEPGPDLGLLGQGSLEGQDVVVWFWAEW